ncbi:unnamed protein product [Brassica rapa]|uniref:RNase H type-1 domain-containing protein n=1 Tax=Brassica campestris TaxID=3711 RepID=A0A3P5ZLH3_BRACM|nr:unnamed protein product [Brassica rapa]VDC76314.1 unnamed protein product [Brassica rapa]
MATQNYIPREYALHSEMEALRWAMESMLQHCQSFGMDCKDLIAMINDPHVWPSFATELEKIETLKTCFRILRLLIFSERSTRFQIS